MKKIQIKGAYHHNLKHIDCEIPHHALTVVSGVSGSGKSSLANDVVYKDAERRYLETYSVYARQFLNKLQRPDIEHISGLMPAIRLEQKNYIASPRSTVGTQTELSDLLRLLYARLGKSTQKDLKINRSLFSFNTPEGACPHCKGLGIADKIDPNLLISDANKTLREGALTITTPSGYTVYSQVTIDVMNQICEAEGFSVDIAWKDLNDYQKNIILYGTQKIKVLFGKHSLESRMKWKGITIKPREEGFYKGIIPVMEEILRRDRNKNILRFVRSTTCESCKGTRLNSDSLSVKFHGKNIAELLAMSIEKLNNYFENLQVLNTETSVFLPIKTEILKRINVLNDLGISYLHLNRNASTLSGGEAARIRLASQINGMLRGVLYVFDEPSAGLHAAEMDKLFQKMEQLVQHGNTILAVEHNEQFIRRADYLLELGADAGEKGGHLLYQGKRKKFTDLSTQVPDSKTFAYLAGKKILTTKKHAGSGNYLHLQGLRARNLKNISVQIPLNRLTVVTGVSGAGKSSLVHHTLANFLRHHLHKTRIDFGEFETISGLEHIDKLIEINQHPIGKTPRSNPATYTKVFDEIRTFFANLSTARAAKFSKSHFSFNVKGGRCETCQGAGYQQVKMHFLSNVEHVCTACGGKRFREEILKINYQGKNIYDVLEMSIHEALDFFGDRKKIAHYLQVLNNLGLGYLKLGQRSSTLSGGEAQRIKLAAELSRPSSGKTLYVLDEPTRGLHFHDIQILLNSLRDLIDKGNTVLVVEHNLHFIRLSDHIIDLGQDSGDKGGELVFSGSVDEIVKCEKSITGEFLKAPCKTRIARSKKTLNDSLPISLKGVKTNNLQNINIDFPFRKITVVTGVSGSGKSSLVFDTLYAESQKRFNESFSPYVRSLLGNQQQADFEKITGITPAIALQQKTLNANARSTVATITEIYDHYRLLYSRMGQLQFPEKKDLLTASHFSFNQTFACCENCSGLGFKQLPDAEKLITNPEKSILSGAMDGTKTGRFYGEASGQYIAVLQAVADRKQVDLSVAWSDLSATDKRTIWEGCGEEIFDVSWNYERKKNKGTHRFSGKWIGFSGHILEEFQRKQANKSGDFLLNFMKNVTCDICKGERLKPLPLAVEIGEKNISQLTKLSVNQSIEFFNKIDNYLNNNELEIFQSLILEIKNRLSLLVRVGLGYLNLDRLTNSLSGGEAQRIRLAGMLGSSLTGLTYVLDEPTVGLHSRDNEQLISVLRELRDLGNTVVVVEHDAELIKAADHIIDMGTLAGRAGGKLVAEGSLQEIIENKKSNLSLYLKLEKQPIYRKFHPLQQQAIEIKGASANNLKKLDLVFYKQAINVLTGVSGSGKSSVLFDVIEKSFQSKIAINCADIQWVTQFDGLLALNKNSSKTSRSIVAAYTGIFDTIRHIFAQAAKKMGAKITKSYFSLSQKGGRCENCKGQGELKVSLDFLPDVHTVCKTCGGMRYKNEALQYKFQGFSIADALSVTVFEAKKIFANNLKISKLLNILIEIGLGYLQLGQTMNTLSGGELQRLRIARELMKFDNKPKLFLIDEPTTGLHFEDVKQLILLFDKLVGQGHTLIITEHNLDLISNADFIVDLGLEGGENGGEIIAQGTVNEIIKNKESITGRYLSEIK